MQILINMSVGIKKFRYYGNDNDFFPSTVTLSKKYEVIPIILKG